MIPALLPTYARNELAFERGEGAYLFATNGRKYLDFASGIAVTALGHCHPHLVKALIEQGQKLWHCSNLFQIPEQQRLGERLVANTFADTVFFNNSGAEACEMSLKVARKYQSETGHPEKYRIIGCNGSFHGRTLATLAAAGNEKYLKGFEPVVDGFDHVPFENMNELRAKITGETAAILVEPVQGEGGVRAGSDQYLRALREVCDEYGLLLVFDEIQCGLGRTGKLFAYEWPDVKPDIMTVAKALANGVPIGATLATEDVARVFTPGTHGSTFGGNPFATAVGLTVFTTLLEERLPERAAASGRILLDGLRAVQKKHPATTGEVRGRGLLVAMDMTVPVGDVVSACRERGLLVLTAGDNALRLAPPLVVDRAEIDRGLEIIDRALEACRR